MVNTPQGDRLRRAMVAEMGGDPSMLDVVGTSVVPHERRRGKRQVACYQLGSHTLLPCDPDIVDEIADYVSVEGGLTDQDFRARVSASGGSVLGQSMMKVAGPGGLRVVASGPELRVMDWSRADDLSLMQAFVDAAEPHDLDEAEVAMDDLDERAIVALQPDGSIGAYASSRPFDEDVAFGDIGVMTASSGRRSGLGVAAVSGLIGRLLQPAGIEPLYRCDPHNTGSDRLSATLGFEVALSLSVAELPPV